MQAAWNQEMFRQERRIWFPPQGAGTDNPPVYQTSKGSPYGKDKSHNSAWQRSDEACAG